MNIRNLEPNVRQMSIDAIKACDDLKTEMVEFGDDIAGLSDSVTIECLKQERDRLEIEISKLKSRLERIMEVANNPV